VGRKEGVSEKHLQDLPQFESSSHFSGKEKLVLRLAVALTRTPADVSDELYAALQKEFSEPDLVELSAVIAWENARARFNRTFAIAAEGFSKGQFCPLPEYEPSSEAGSTIRT
jgi:alkylhydroperoxidase family enzyme